MDFKLHGVEGVDRHFVFFIGNPYPGVALSAGFDILKALFDISQKFVVKIIICLGMIDGGEGGAGHGL